MYKINNFTYYGINPVQEFELIARSQNSFYGKAKIIIDENGEIFLRSYNTLVCYINKNKEFVRLWEGYSNTTQKHINDFCKLYGFKGYSKKEWLNLPIEKH